MRHVFLFGAITARPIGMMKTATATALIASRGLLLVVLSRGVGAVGIAIALPAIAGWTQQDLATASRAQEKSGNWLQRGSQEKTESAGHLSQ